MILKLYTKARNQQASTGIWGSVACNEERGSSSRGTSKNDEKIFKGATIKKTWVDKREEAKLAREKEA